MGVDARSILLVKSESSHSSVLMGLCLLEAFNGALSVSQALMDQYYL